MERDETRHWGGGGVCRHQRRRRSVTRTSPLPALTLSESSSADGPLLLLDLDACMGLGWVAQMKVVLIVSSLETLEVSCCRQPTP
jgi:hypothetical protein